MTQFHSFPKVLLFAFKHSSLMEFANPLTLFEKDLYNSWAKRTPESNISLPAYSSVVKICLQVSSKSSFAHYIFV